MLTGSRAGLQLTAIATAQRTELWLTSFSSKLVQRKSSLITARYVFINGSLMCDVIGCSYLVVPVVTFIVFVVDFTATGGF